MIGGSWIPARKLIFSELTRIGREDLAGAFQGPEKVDTGSAAHSRSAPLVQEWVDACRAIDPDVRRGDPCQPLKLPPAFPELVMQRFAEVGLYVATLSATGAVDGLLSCQRWFH